MDRIGTHPSGMRKQQEKDIFLSRLQLLIVMAKAFLKNYQLGNHRAISVKNNAARLTEVLSGWESYKAHFPKADPDAMDIHLDHILFQRIKLLLVMAVSFADGNPIGTRRKLALRNNMDYIAECLNFNSTSTSIAVLSVA